MAYEIFTDVEREYFKKLGWVVVVEYKYFVVLVATKLIRIGDALDSFCEFDYEILSATPGCEEIAIKKKYGVDVLIKVKEEYDNRCIE